jgi:Metallo-peptidase family M12/Reprolysin family propeptide
LRIAILSSSERQAPIYLEGPIPADKRIALMNTVLRPSHRSNGTRAPRRADQINKHRAGFCGAALLALLALGFLCSSALQGPVANAQIGQSIQRQDLAEVFSAYEETELDPHQVVERVQQSGHLAVHTPAHDFEIDLQLNDLRGPGYRAEEVSEDGVSREIQMPAPNTYKGRVSGMPESTARFTLSENRLEGMIITGSESYFIEPERKYSSMARDSDYLLYRASDVRPDIRKTCGATLDEEIKLETSRLASSSSSGLSPEVFSPFKVVEIATEADFEYVSALGGSSATNSDILSVMNAVQGIYERDIGLTFSVVFQHTWATANDPYNTSGDIVGALNEFTNYWNANFASQPRDVTHLWTGRDMGGPAGVGFVGVVCRDAAHSYGLSDLEQTAPFRIGIPAHEIGHNLNASHCDGQPGCDNTIMVATQFPSNTLTFCPFSVNEITTYVNGNSSCLSLAAGNPIDQPDFFIRQHYFDFLNRQPDPNGLAFWTNEIISCGSDQTCIQVKRVNVSASFFLSIEFQQTGYLVERIYKTAYGDASGSSNIGGTHQLSVPIVRFAEFLPDTTSIGNGVVVGQTGWEQQLETNKQNFTAQFVQRQRFTNAYPATMLPSTFVQTLNRNAGSPLAASELATLIAEHTVGTKNRAQVLRQIAEHQNLQTAEFNRAFVLMQYFGYLRRNPNDAPDADYSGYDFWLTKLNQFNGNYVNAELVKAFITSIEYRKRFGQ